MDWDKVQFHKALSCLRERPARPTKISDSQLKAVQRLVTKPQVHRSEKSEGNSSRNRELATDETS